MQCFFKQNFNEYVSLKIIWLTTVCFLFDASFRAKMGCTIRWKTLKGWSYPVMNEKLRMDPL
jgi:hypothetical protein